MSEHATQRPDSRDVTRTVLVLLLCLGTLVALSHQVARTASDEMVATAAWTQSWVQDEESLMGSWQFASAHENVLALNVTRQQVFRVDTDVMLLVARDVSAALALALPLLGLFAGLALPARSRLRVLAPVVLGVGVPLGVAVSLAWVASTHGWTMGPAVWSRLGVWIVIVSAYFNLFLLLGRWIQRRTGSTKRSLWVYLTLVCAMATIQGSRPLLMRVDGSIFPAVPDLPTEVKLSLFRPSGEPQVTADRVQIVDEYLAAVDTYSQQVHDVVAQRYALERWWHVVSPQLLMDEIAGQLLQTDYANAVDVVFSEDRAPPSLATSLGAVWPEIAWLVALCGLCGAAGLRAERREGGSEE